MNESALKAALGKLEASQSGLHTQLDFWTWWVVIGVALEIIFVIWEYREELHDLRVCTLHPPIRPNIQIFVFGLFAAGLVAIGVAGELAVDAKLGTVETQIRGINNQLYVLLSTEAGNAATSAKTANDAADRVKEQADLLTIRLAAASQKLNGLKRDTEALQKLSAATQTELAAERAEVKVMRANLADRMLPVITGPQGNTVKLWPFSGLRVIIEYVPDDSEAKKAVGEIRSFVAYAGWHSDDSDVKPNALLLNGFFDGVKIETYDAFDHFSNTEATKERIDAATRSGDAAAALLAVMHAEGWDASTVPGNPFGIVPENAIKIMVGRKLDHFQQRVPR